MQRDDGRLAETVFRVAQRGPDFSQGVGCLLLADPGDDQILNRLDGEPVLLAADLRGLLLRNRALALRGFVQLVLGLKSKHQQRRGKNHRRSEHAERDFESKRHFACQTARLHWGDAS